MKDKKIFVTGGTGFLGSYLLRYLVHFGYTNIVALKRTDSPMDLVQSVQDKIQWVEGDILDVVLLEEVMQGVDLVYHVAAVVSYSPEDKGRLTKVNVEGTANIVNIALFHQVEKLVHVSSTSAVGRSVTQYRMDETSKWQRNETNTKYGISKHQAEMEVWRGAAEGLQVAMINPSIILGAGFWDRGTTKFFRNGWNNFKFYAQGGTGFVDVRDVARAAIVLMESDISGERYIINGANLDFKVVQTLIAKALNKRPPSVKVTPLIQEVAWRAAKLQSLLMGKRPFITKETARKSAKKYIFENQKSKEQLGLLYTPLEQTIQETANLLKVAAQNDFAPSVLTLRD